jgi:hypothetical protein
MLPEKNYKSNFETDTVSSNRITCVHAETWIRARLERLGRNERSE